MAENVVTQAEDAFGVSINRESIGLYDPALVRGFSPTAAGNARIEGLYFDQVWSLSARLRRSTTIRVGLAAQSFPFPAPTGIVDYSFRRPGDKAGLTAFASADTYTALSLELDGVVPLAKDRLSVGIGAAGYRDAYANGTAAGHHVFAASLRWTPSKSLEILPFWVRSDIHDQTIAPLYTPAGNFLPPPPARRRFVGPRWAIYDGTAMNYGVLASWKPAGNWAVRLGVFRSLFDNNRDSFTFLEDLHPDGGARLTAIVDPPTKFASTSGELRVTRTIADGARLHTVHAMLRARAADRRYAGTDFLDFGPYQLNARVRLPRPDFRFGAQTTDRVEQVTGGLAYVLKWKGVGEASVGVQKTDYSKRIAAPGLPLVRDRASPWLPNATLALNLTPRVVIYGSFVRGLEESGVAPANAANRNDALPAIETEQYDAGVRWAVAKSFRLVAGVFDVSKPYFNLDEVNVWRELGLVRNRGIELSASGQLTSKLSVVAGAVLLDPRVSGEGVALGRIGPRPVGSTPTRLLASVNWETPLKGVAVDVNAAYQGDIEATRLNTVRIPERTIVDLGARYIFKAGGRDVLARVQLSNIGNVYGFDLAGAGTYDIIAGRVATFSLTTDF